MINGKLCKKWFPYLLSPLELRNKEHFWNKHSHLFGPKITLKTIYKKTPRQLKMRQETFKDKEHTVRAHQENSQTNRDCSLVSTDRWTAHAELISEGCCSVVLAVLQV